MGGLLKSLAVRFIKARWGSILPALFKAAAEGQFGEPAKKLYWLANGYATFTGAVFLGLGTAVEAIGSSYPEWVWCKPAGQWIFQVGGVLAAVGLLRGGVNSPWPEGAQIAHKEK